MRELIRFLLVGFVSGWIAAILVRTPVRLRGCLTHVVVGMLGSVMGGYLFELLGIGGVGSVVAAMVGAVAFLTVVRLLRTV